MNNNNQNNTKEINMDKTTVSLPISIRTAVSKEELQAVNKAVQDMGIVRYERLMNAPKEALIDHILLWQHRAERK